jgi:anti-sigma regulatory factor (Ser/Thr protein kinase)/biotin operon repressor
MDAKRTILAFLAKRRGATGGELRAHLGITRQAMSPHLRALIREGRVLKSGSTRGARYALAGQRVPAAIRGLVLRLRGADEARVYEGLATTLNLKSQLRPSQEGILHYAFTEMLNNAIEHSGSERAEVRVSLTPAAVRFEVRDRGIGVFQSIRAKFGLADEAAALVELLKGKTTTMRERHSGEGIFFTSRAADGLVLESHRMRVEWSRPRGDVFVSQRRFLTGTRVAFELERATRRRLEDVFGEFAPAEYDYRFEKTRVAVRLLQSEYVSRSEAKRLLTNLEKFRDVALDFDGVRTLGQGFADEVFRVFAAAHPETTLAVENANQAVAAMIRHAGG